MLPERLAVAPPSMPATGQHCEQWRRSQSQRSLKARAARHILRTHTAFALSTLACAAMLAAPENGSSGEELCRHLRKHKPLPTPASWHGYTLSLKERINTEIAGEGCRMANVKCPPMWLPSCPAGHSSIAHSYGARRAAQNRCAALLRSAMHPACQTRCSKEEARVPVRPGQYGAVRGDQRGAGKACAQMRLATWQEG